MRAKVAVFFFGLTVGMWTDAILVELDKEYTVYEWIVGPSVTVNEQLIEESHEAAEEEDIPDSDWLNAKQPRYRGA